MAFFKDWNILKYECGLKNIKYFQLVHVTPRN